MDQKIKRKWIKALRSGRYKQTQNELYSPDEKSYCCFGVLCRVVKVRRTPDKGFIWKEDSDEMVLPTGLRNELKITRRQETRLIEMNDEQGKSFKEIAAYIAKHL